MHRLSMIQALDVWQSLEDAYRRDASHGDTAEIYLYRLMPYSPTVAANIGRETDSYMAKNAVAEAIQQANESLLSLLVHFAQKRDAIIEVDRVEHGKLVFVEIGDWLKSCGNGHRCNVRVRSRRQAAKSST